MHLQVRAHTSTISLLIFNFLALLLMYISNHSFVNQYHMGKVYVVHTQVTEKGKKRCPRDPLESR